MEPDKISEATMNPESISNYMVRALTNYIKPHVLDARTAAVVKQKAKALEDSYFKNKKIDKKILEELATIAFISWSTGEKEEKTAADQKTIKQAPAATSGVSSTTTSPKMTYPQVKNAVATLSPKNQKKLLAALQQQLATPSTP